MIIVQWAEADEMTLQGQQYYDHEYADALLDYWERRGDWDIVRIILAHDEGRPSDDWVTIHMDSDRIGVHT